MLGGGPLIDGRVALSINEALMCPVDPSEAPVSEGQDCGTSWCGRLIQAEVGTGSVNWIDVRLEPGRHELGVRLDNPVGRLPEREACARHPGHISEKTASVHVTHILDKLGVTSRGAAAALAARGGLVDAPGD
jgi:hypothetical protein